MFISNDATLRCALADYARDFGGFSGRFVQTPVGADLWHATLASQQMIGTRLVELEFPNGKQYVLNGRPEILCADTGLGLSVQSGLLDAYKHFSSTEMGAPLLPPYYEGATKLIRYRQLSFSMLVTLTAHYCYLADRTEESVTIAQALQQILAEFRKLPELYDEALLREGMDNHADELGFKASHHIVVGDDSFERYLRRVVEALAPKQIAALQAEVDV